MFYLDQLFLVGWVFCALLALWLPKNATFNHSISFLDGKTLNGPSFTEEAIFYQRDRFLKITCRCKNVEYFNLVHLHKPKFVLVPFLPFPIPSFSCFFPFHFLGPFTLATFCTASFSGCHKNLGVNYRQSLEMRPWSIMGIVGYFITIFALAI